MICAPAPPGSSPVAASAARRVDAFSRRRRDPGRIGLDDPERRVGRGGGAGGSAGREDQRPRGVDEQVADLAARRRRRRRSCPSDLPRVPTRTSTSSGEPGLGDRAAPARPERADGVGVVDHQHRAVAAGELAQPAELGDVAVHREEAVGDDQAAVTRQPPEAPGEVLEVAVAVDERLGAGEAAAVDDARVVELVGEDHVAAAGERGDRRRCSRGSRSRRAAPSRCRGRRRGAARAGRGAPCSRRRAARPRRRRPSARPPRRRPP